MKANGAFVIFLFATHCFTTSTSGADDDSESQSRWLSVAANLEVGYRATQFFEENHNVAVGLWDSRIEMWLPPHRGVFSFGPYARFAGIAASQDPAWENALLAGPGAGFQLYPFSYDFLDTPDSTVLDYLGPIRLFAEKNRLDYWGTANSWRPRDQTRAGGEYWLSLHPNDLNSPWWGELWGGLWWQSANEFDEHYDTWISAQSVRFGLRIPKAGALSCITPYALAESSRTANETYYWENRLLTGVGLRIAPQLSGKRGTTRFVVFAEYARVESYYRTAAPDTVPVHDWRFGININFGEWYHELKDKRK